MIIKVKSDNKEIKHRLEFLFFTQIAQELEYLFVEKDKYAIEFEPASGVIGLTMMLPTATPAPEWQIIDTRTMSAHQCLNRIAMIHLMCFTKSPADFSNFVIEVTLVALCECGGEKVGTTHSTWCPKYD